MARPKRPHFQVDFEHLTSQDDALDLSYRRLSNDTIRMALAALEAMKFNRYWRYGKRHLTIEEQHLKNDKVHQAMYEIMTDAELLPREVEITEIDYQALYEDWEDEFVGKLSIIHIGNEAYLTEDCGCGTQYYKLSNVPVTLTDCGVTIPTEKDYETGREFEPVGDDFVTCYGLKAAPYLMQRASEFYEFSEDVTSLGWEVATDTFGDILEILDATAIISDLLGGEDGSSIIDIMRGHTAAEISAAMVDPDYVAALAAAWTYQGPVSRAEIVQWIKAGPAVSQGISIRPFFNNWLNFSLIKGYNDFLEVFASECRNGTSTGDWLLGDPTAAYQEWTTPEGKTYPFWQWYPDVELIHGTGLFSWTPPLTVVETGAIGITSIGYGVGDGTYAYVESRLNSLVTLKWLSPSVGTWGVMAGSAAAKAALDAFTGMDNENGLNGSNTGWGAVITDQVGSVHWQLDRVIVVGEEIV